VEKAKAQPDARIREMLLFFVEQGIWGMSVLARYAPTHFSQVNQYLNGVYYVGSQLAECSPGTSLMENWDDSSRRLANSELTQTRQSFNTGTAASLPLRDGRLTTFTDPPFGENIYYADLNFLVEAWHGVITDATPEAIVDKFKKKALPEYQH
jgi:hypothetical protein